MKSMCWNRGATDLIIKSGQMDTEASIQTFISLALEVHETSEVL